ncbi:MAG TPA: acyltransferase [Patescibacteria group bacterium]
MKENRIVFIDNLRAFSLLGVIVIHTLSFHLSNPINAFFWNFLEFVVVTFIFCSGFVNAHYEGKLKSLSDIFLWYKKRFFRLYFPFFLYFLIHFILFFFFPNIFNHFAMQKNIYFFIGSFFLFWGSNSNWLPLIFLQLSFITPLIFFLRKKGLIWIYLLLAGVITAWFGLVQFPYSYYRIVMWIPWSFVLFFGLYFPKKFIKQLYLLMGSLLIYIVSYFILLNSHKSLNFYDNKYPPTFFYISFGIFLTIISTWILSFVNFPTKIQKSLFYISKNSYALFFIHYIILDFLESTALSKNYLLEMVIVAISSILFLLIIQKVKLKLNLNI